MRRNVYRIMELQRSDFLVSGFALPNSTYMTRIATNHATIGGGVILACFRQRAMAGVVFSQFEFGIWHAGASFDMDFMVAVWLGKGVDVIVFHDWLCGPNLSE